MASKNKGHDKSGWRNRRSKNLKEGKVSPAEHVISGVSAMNIDDGKRQSTGTYRDITLTGSCLDTKVATLNKINGFFIHTPSGSEYSPGVSMSDPGGNLCDVTVERMEHDVYQCSFTPRVVGKYQIMVCYQMMNIPGSPFTIDVEKEVRIPDSHPSPPVIRETITGIESSQAHPETADSDEEIESSSLPDNITGDYEAPCAARPVSNPAYGFLDPDTIIPISNSSQYDWPGAENTIDHSSPAMLRHPTRDHPRSQSLDHSLPDERFTSASKLQRATIDTAQIGSAWEMVPGNLKAKLQRSMRPGVELEIGRELGQGEFGKVFEVRMLEETKGASIVAAKTIKATGLTQHNLEDFLKEAVLMQNFKHKHVLELLGVVIKDGSPYILVPVMEKGNLKNYLKKSKKDISRAQMTSYALQVALGMAYITSLKFVHRDLAARNCLVDKHDLVKISDFGLARDSFKENYMMATKYRQLPFKWMAPEIVKDWTFTSETDVWAFGVLLWEIFTCGETPYDDIDNQLLMMALQSGRKLARPDTASEEMYKLMLQCWDLEPKQRPTFAQIVDILKSLPLEERL